MQNDELRHATWRKSNSSGDGGCVEVALTPTVIGVRDTKDRDAAELRFNAQEWRAFIEGVKRGEFDL